MGKYPDFNIKALQISYAQMVESNPEFTSQMHEQTFIENSEPFMWIAYPAILLFSLFFFFFAILALAASLALFLASAFICALKAPTVLKPTSLVYFPEESYDPYLVFVYPLLIEDATPL